MFFYEQTKASEFFRVKSSECISPPPIGWMQWASNLHLTAHLTHSKSVTLATYK